MTQQSRRAFLRRVGIAGGATVALGSASAQSDPVRMRAIHASPDAPAVDVLVNDQSILEGASFPTVGGYFEGTAEAFTIRVVTADGGEQLAGSTWSFDPGTAHTLTVAGAGDGVHLEVFVDRIERPEGGKSDWRAINLIPDAPGFDVVVPSRQTFFRGVEFGEQSRYDDIVPDTYGVVLRRGGTGEQVLRFDGVTLEPDTVYSAVLVGRMDGDPEPSLLRAEDRSFRG